MVSNATMSDTGGADWNPARYQANAGFVPAALGQPVLDLLAPQPGERILDLGCGDGALTRRLVAAGSTVVGVDSSPAMVEKAKADGLDARLGDAAALPFAAEFDAVFSNAALHWVRDQEGAIASVARSLRPGGRFVGEMGGHGNVAAIRVALIAVLGRHGLDGAACLPWTFPTAAEHAARLERHGFVVDQIALFARPVELPTDLDGWLHTFAEPVFVALPAALRAAAQAEAVALLRPVLCAGDGRWTADYVRLRFAAHQRR